MLLGVIFLTGCGEKTKDVRYFSEITDCEVFQTVPMMVVEGAQAGKTIDYGDETYVIDVNGTSTEDYRQYLNTLANDGFKKYVDNGEEGLDGSVLSATYTKDKLTITVIHIVKRDKTYISASETMNLSEHLFYKDEYVKDNKKGAKTKVHMPEMYEYGNSFIIQLKNGHFILNDGGYEQDMPYLLDYLESLVPDGEKPVIEAWFISHGHLDHVGPFVAFMRDFSQADRICVEGIYFTKPSEELLQEYNMKTDVQNAIIGSYALKTSSGESTAIYRPQTGQRYYFNDITIDILHTQEQLVTGNYLNGFNESSTWMMYNIEGQKFMLCGDAGEGSVLAVKRTYNQEYFNVDVMAVFHHGTNVYDSYVDYFNYKTLIYPHYMSGTTVEGRIEATKKLLERTQEAMSWGDGAKILTFPYKIGTYQSLPLQEWSYHPDRVAPNADTKLKE